MILILCTFFRNNKHNTNNFSDYFLHLHLAAAYICVKLDLSRQDTKRD